MIAWPEGENPAGQVINLPEDGGIVGRQEGCDVYLPDASRVLSRQHCDIRPSDGGYTIHDLSRNGLRINGECIPVGAASGSPGRMLHDGDLLALGDYRLLVSHLTPLEQHHAQRRVEVADAVELSAPPLLTEKVMPELSDNIMGGWPQSPSDTQVLPPMESRTWENDDGGGFAFAHGLAGIDALTDEVLREFSPERLEHKLAPWRGKGWRRQSWWSLYRSYYQHMERTGELRIRLREWFLRSGGFGSGGS